LPRGAATFATVQAAHGLALAPSPLYLLDRRQNPAPDKRAVNVAFLEHQVRLAGGINRRLVAALVDHQLGGPEDVGIVNHRYSGPIQEFDRDH
jgi:hypothetical protein